MQKSSTATRKYGALQIDASRATAGWRHCAQVRPPSMGIKPQSPSGAVIAAALAKYMQCAPSPWEMTTLCHYMPSLKLELNSVRNYVEKLYVISCRRTLL